MDKGVVCDRRNVVETVVLQKCRKPSTNRAARVEKEAGEGQMVHKSQASADKQSTRCSAGRQMEWGRRGRRVWRGGKRKGAL